MDISLSLEIKWFAVLGTLQKNMKIKPKKQNILPAAKILNCMYKKTNKQKN